MPSVVVTGGTRGIGLAIGRHLSQAGMDVVAVGRKCSPDLLAAMEENEGCSGSLRFHTADLAAVGSLSALARDLWREHGPIFGLVNNAGVGPAGLLAMARDSDIERTVRLNVLSPILLSKYLSRRMMGEGQGRIVNIASIAGLTGFKGLAVYAATKAALIGLSRSLARELGPAGITVNAVAPGLIDTELTAGIDPGQREQVIRRSAMGRLVERDDIARAVAYFLGEGGRRITGSVLVVDAGATA
ncbi:MAG: SDR family oxidoreductase [Alphaproteobacteria bacterium]|nr:SDR family oxidoreductase [Alphaproteobacteria bacterium]MBV9695187.1 SDR family oxidoreductase [Alphaproteobacteria bacterium]